MRENMNQKDAEYGYFSRIAFAGSEPVCEYLYETSIQSPGSLPLLQYWESLYQSIQLLL